MGTYLESKSFLLVKLEKRQNQNQIIFLYFTTGDMKSLISLTSTLALLGCVAGDGFTHTEFGVKCSAIGLSDLATKDACQNSVAYAASFSPGVSFGGVGSWTSPPKGCYVSKNTNKIYWNTLGGSGSPTWARSICQQDKCPEEKYPKDRNTINCYKNIGNTWCSSEIQVPLARSEWGEWICKNCGSCIPRHENNSTTPECRSDYDCSAGVCDNGHCMCMDRSRACSSSPLRRAYDCRSSYKRTACPKMCGVCGTKGYVEKSNRRACAHAKGGSPLRCGARGRSYRSTRACEYACSATSTCVGFSQGKPRTNRQYDCILFVSGASCPSYYRAYPGKVASSGSDLVGTGPGNFICRVKKE